MSTASTILGADGRPARAAESPSRSSRGRKPAAKSIGWGEIYEAAERRDFKGYFYIPSLNPTEQAPSYTRRALQERIDFLYKNVGAVTMLIDGLALEEAGTGLWPKWESSNPAFNKRMTDAFHYANHDPRIFSADGESDYYAAQYNIRRMIRLYGDCFGQLLRPSEGSVNPQCLLIPGWRVDGEGSDNPNWKDGILRNELGRKIAVNVQSGERMKQSMVVAAEDILHFHDNFLPGQNRGISDLASVAKRLFRREDILKALANGTLARERLGFALESVSGADGQAPDPLGGEGETEVVTNANGTRYTLQKFFGPTADEEIEIPNLPPGTKLNTVESNRPGSAQTDFLDSILRESAWPTLYPPEYVFFLAGLGQGTVARVVLKKVRQVAIARRSFQLKPQFCNRWNVFWAWQRIKAGGFDDIEGGIPEADWWKHKILADADMSVDVGREGNLYDSRVSTGKMGVDDYHAMSGEDGDDVEDQNLAVRQRRMDKLKKFNEKNKTTFTYFDLWPPTPQNPQLAGPQPATVPPEEQP